MMQIQLASPFGGGAQCAHWAERVNSKPSQSKIKDFCHIFIGMLATGKHIDTYSLRYSQGESQKGTAMPSPFIPLQIALKDLPG